MPRVPRTSVNRSIVHVVNRGNDRRRLFAFRGDYDAFLGILSSTQRREGLPLLGYVVMPNHWHLVAWPESVPQLSRFMQRVTSAHAAIVRTHSHSTGQGHVYQGRYHATVVTDDVQLFRTLRYVEANPVRAGLVGRAEFWRWSSLDERLGSPRLIVEAPVPLPPVATWLDLVNTPAGDEDRPDKPRRPRLGVAVALDAAPSTDGDRRDRDRPGYK
jgi:putative transposase